MFSKLKNILKMFKGKFSHYLLIVFIGILFKIAIFFPCPVYGNHLFVGQGIFESSKSVQMRSDIVRIQIPADIRSITTSRIDVGFQNIKLNDEGISELARGFIKFGDGVNTEGVFIPDPPSNECANNSKATSNDYKFIGTKVQFWSYLLMGGIIGLIIACSILRLVFYFLTQ